MTKAAAEAVKRADLKMDDISLIIPHQANLRIIRAVAKSLHVPVERMYINVDRYGNTSAASVPMALCETIDEGRIKPGDNIVLVAFGTGLSWAAVTLRWGVPVSVPARPWWRNAVQVLRSRKAAVKSASRRASRKIDAWCRPNNGILRGE
jgi:3-oxoacyl-[acyl-carrier-protein] synthase-3